MNTSNAKNKNKGIYDFIKLMGISIIIGIIIGIFFALMDDNGIIITTETLSNWLTQQILYIQIAAVFLIVPPVLYTIIQAHYHLKTNAPNDDETLALYEENLDKKLNSAISFNVTSTILQCILFGFSIGGFNPNQYASALLFIGLILINTVLDMHALKLLKRYYGKSFSLFSKNFEKEYLASCDESEKDLIYRSSYDTFVFMKNTFVCLLTVSVLTKLFLNTGNFPIFLIGSAWLIQTMAYLYFGKKHAK